MSNAIKQNKQKGIAAIIMVVIIGTVSLLMATGFTKTGLNNLEIADNNLKGEQALYIAEGCIEDSLELLYINSNYAVEDLTQSMGRGACSVSVRGEGIEKIIESAGIIGQYHKKIIVRLSQSDGAININSWRETE